MLVSDIDSDWRSVSVSWAEKIGICKARLLLFSISQCSISISDLNRTAGMIIVNKVYLVFGTWVHLKTPFA